MKNPPAAELSDEQFLERLLAVAEKLANARTTR